MINCELTTLWQALVCADYFGSYWGRDVEDQILLVDLGVTPS